MTQVVMEGSELRTEALAWPDQARALRIADVEQYTSAADMLKSIKALRGRLAETFDPHIKRAHEAHRALCKEKQDAEAPLAEAELIIKRAMIAFDDVQDRIRREEERKRQEEAKRAEEARRLAEAAAMEREAVETGNQALLEEALELVEAPVVAPVVAPVEKQTPKVTGVAYREVWKFRIVNASQIPLEYRAIDEQKIGQVVRAMKGATNIPGVVAYADKQIAAGSR